MDLTLISKIKEGQKCMSVLGVGYMMFSPLLLLSKVGNGKMQYSIRDYGILFHNQNTCYLLPLTSDKPTYVKGIMEVIKERHDEIDCVPARCAEYLKSKGICRANLSDKEFINSMQELVEMPGKKFKNIRCNIHKIERDEGLKLVELSKENSAKFMECNAEWYRLKRDDFFRLFLKREIEYCIENYDEFKEHFRVKCYGVEQDNKIIGFTFGSEISTEYRGCIFQRRADLDNPGLGHYMLRELAKDYTDFEYENDGGASSKGITELKTRLGVGMQNVYSLIKK